MCEILVKAIDHVHPNAEKDRRGAWKKGYPVSVRPDGFRWGGAEALPRFVILRLPGVPVDDFKRRVGPHAWDLSIAIVSHQALNDTYTLRLAVDSTRGSPLGQHGRDRLTTFLSRAGAGAPVFDEDGANFSLAVRAFFESQAVLGPLASGTLTEVNYNKGSGIHRMRINYSALGAVAPAQVVKRVRNFGNIVSHASRVMTYDVRRDRCPGMLQEWLAEIGAPHTRSRWKLPAALVDQAIAQGGTLIVARPALDAAFTDQAG